jgi:sulfatase modifying factor 1
VRGSASRRAARPDRFDSAFLSRPHWAGAHGLDAQGPWAEVTVGGRHGTASQRFRWIPPGEFRMGSPEDEPERFDDEARHRVVLTQGFWLADTACTQALWQAVLGRNPSTFRDDPGNPVECVSWNEITGRFLPELNRLVPGLEAGLPTEAQWEYACRAGSETPFWFGEQITTGQVNYDGNRPYHNGPRGEFRERTLPVKALPVNGWGLYEMHGSVWEWCADAYGEYPTGEAVDPTGPAGLAGGDEAVGARRRVLRGGGWDAVGGYCRSAGRFAGEPDGRRDGIGFRLARGLAEAAGPEGRGRRSRAVCPRSGRSPLRSCPARSAGQLRAKASSTTGRRGGGVG